MKRDYLNEILIDSRHGDLPNIATIERVRLERDALRAEVERLRSALTGTLAALDAAATGATITDPASYAQNIRAQARAALERRP